MATPDRLDLARTATRAAGAVSERIQDTQAAIDETIQDLGRKADEVVTDARDQWTALDKSLRRTVRERPYTALAVAGAIGFLYAIARR